MTPLANVVEVRRDAVVVGGEPGAHPAEPGDHLVEDQQRAVLVAQPAGLGEVAVDRREDAGGALHRLGDHGGEAVGVLGHQHRQRLDVVARHLHHVGEQLAVARPCSAASPWALVPP